jgi:hypothetical protein
MLQVSVTVGILVRGYEDVVLSTVAQVWWKMHRLH